MKNIYNIFIVILFLPTTKHLLDAVQMTYLVSRGSTQTFKIKSQNKVAKL